MELGVASVKDKSRKSNGCQCGSLPGFSFWMKVVEWGAFCMNLYIFCFMISPVQQVRISNLPTKLRFWICFFRGKRETLALSHVQPASPLLDAAAGLSLYLACSLNNEHRFECIDCGYYHYLGPHHNNKFLHSGTQQRSRYAVELLVLDEWIMLLNQSKLMDVPFTTNS